MQGYEIIILNFIQVKKLYNVCSFTDSYDNYTIEAYTIEQARILMKLMGLSTETHWVIRDEQDLENELYDYSAE